MIWEQKEQKRQNKLTQNKTPLNNTYVIMLI